MMMLFWDIHQFLKESLNLSVFSCSILPPSVNNSFIMLITRQFFLLLLLPPSPLETKQKTNGKEMMHNLFRQLKGTGTDGAPRPLVYRQKKPTA